MSASLPSVIEVVPLEGPVRARVTVPGSKSITNRALILAALADGETTLRGALWSEDTQVLVESLQRLGFGVRIAAEDEPANRRLIVEGQGGRIPRGGTGEKPLELFVGNAGTAARFLAALVCLGQGAYRLHGVPRMHERPQAALFAALRQLGYRIDSPRDRLPAIIHGIGPRPGHCEVDIRESSQFASALLLNAATGGWDVVVTGENSEESPYVEMTRRLLGTWPSSRRPRELQVEPDASSGSYFWAAGWLIHREAWLASGGTAAHARGWFETHGVCVDHWPASDWQIDAGFPGYLAFPPEISRERDLGDSIMTAVVLTPFAPRPVRFADLGRLRLQECERVVALRTELTKCGARVSELGDALELVPSSLHGADIQTYGDHRMAMCFAILGLKVAGMRIHNPACVKKTFPNFYQKLAAPPPEGLGARILDGATGTPLSITELAAD